MPSPDPDENDSQRSHRSPAAVRQALGLPIQPDPEGGGGRPPLQRPSLPTVEAPLGDGVAEEINELFELVQDAGYHIRPGEYAVRFDDAGRPMVTMTVYPPSVIDRPSDGAASTTPEAASASEPDESTGGE